MESERIIKVIPKNTKPIINIETGEHYKKKVAAYARVSTDLEDQKNSFAAQLDEYKTRIEKNPEWEFVKLYSDEGITGTSIKKRPGFGDMIKDALDGKIDLILVKSISRFARNTVDCVQTVRDLRAKNVEVWFDKESISTNDSKINLLLTMFASFAEEESHSISENVKWGVRKRMAKGQRKMVTSTTLGYLTRPDGKVVVDESERDIIILIFNLYLSGLTLRKIADYLNEKGIKTGSGKSEWNLVHVQRILTDEKYIGNFVMQKTVVKDFLDHKSYKNDGIEPKYIEVDHHEAIISKTTFDLVQTIMKKRFDNDKGGKATTNFLRGLIYCESCFRIMRPILHHPGKAYKKLIFTCKTTAKSSLNYRKCEITNTLSYELVKLAINEVIKKFVDVPKIDKNVIEEAYKKSLLDIQNKITVLKEDNDSLQKKLAQLLKDASNSTSIDEYKFEYDNTKKLIEKNKEEILTLENELYVSHKKHSELCSYLIFSDDDIISYNFLKEHIGAVVRKIDGSIRIVLSSNQTEINETVIKKISNAKSKYTSIVSNGRETLNFDVIDWR
ncbi:MAG: recombinase family protein [Bacilli bacterium]|nr:recombinase family protein [Bacilli bacterium]